VLYFAHFRLSARRRLARRCDHRARSLSGIICILEDADDIPTLIEAKKEYEKLM